MNTLNHITWWRHQMETFSALLAICAGNSPTTGEFPTQRPVTRSFDVFLDLCLNKRLSKQSWGWWFETPLHPLWRQCNLYLTDADTTTPDKYERAIEELKRLKFTNCVFFRWLMNYIIIEFSIRRIYIGWSIWLFKCHIKENDHAFGPHLLTEIKAWISNLSMRYDNSPNSKVYMANRGPIWGRQDPGGSMLAPWTLLSGSSLS